MWPLMRDADVGASPGPGSAAAAAAAGRARTPRPRPPPRRQSRRQQRTDHPGQHVTGPGGGRPGLAGRIEIDRAAGIGDDGDIALEQHGGAQRVGQLAAGPHAVVIGRRPGQPGELTGVRRQDRRGVAARHQIGVVRQHGQPSASTNTGRSVSSANHNAAAPASSVPRPGPTTQACTRPAAAGVGEAMTSGQCARTSAWAVPA
ncbi:bifunctional ADP-dependent (S)-NAD(P)H-hydrate dehydratase/NAD(P)H-hydrate epimerase [Mycobacterium tuberculosis variant africanum]|nr:bifunctional ADP-dependent (S)-NAD(P)H-hydrate dehydratase/NAD(P)H-hydrate epimerase [Mycobacterium tuberculosis variant africanum]